MAIRRGRDIQEPFGLATHIAPVSTGGAVAGGSRRAPRADHQHPMPPGTQAHAQLHGSGDHIEDYALALAGLRPLNGPASYNLTGSDGVCLINATDGNVIINLPAITTTTSPPQAGSPGKVYAFFRLDGTANEVRLVPSGTDVILGDEYVVGYRNRVIITADVSVTPYRWVPITSFRGPLQVMKPVSTSRASTTALAADPHLQVPVRSTGVYFFQALIFYSAGTTGDIKSTITAPTGAVGGWSPSGISGNVGFNQLTTSTNGMVPFGTTRSHGGGGSAEVCALFFVGWCSPGADGTLAYSWAQDVSDTVATEVRAGSALWVQRV